MIFLIVDTDSYDILLNLDFLMKIGAIVDVEKGVIQLQNGLGMAVELLPLTIVIMLHLVVEQKLSPSFQLVKEGMQSLSLKEQVHEEDLMTHNPNDDPTSNSKMNESESEAKDDQKMIIHNLKLPMEGLMD
jgi:hypothetical protein